MFRHSINFRYLIPAVLVIWAIFQLGTQWWLFAAEGVSGDEITKRLLRSAILLAALLGILIFLLHWVYNRRIHWLVEEAGRIECGEAPREALGGGDIIAGLSRSIRDMALHLGNLRRAIDEHSIVAFTDRQGKITFVNDKFCAISGYSREELLGKTHRLINSGRHPIEFFKDMWKTIASGKVWRGEIENRAKDGSHYFVATTIVPFAGAGGKPEQYVAIRTDVTEQKAAAERLRTLTQELEAKNNDLEMLIHAASHDLRSPLVNVQGFASVIGEQAETIRAVLNDAVEGRPPARESAGTITDEIQDAVRFIGAGAQKMDGLLKGLLAFSRLGRAAPDLQAVDATALVKQSLSATRFQIDECGADVAVDPLPSCLADAGLLDQAVSNLIDNAIKYRDPSRPLRLHISGSVNGKRSIYRFEDNGIGIAPEHQGKIFDLFHRLDPRKNTGYGIGLAVVKRAIERLGGSVTVDSVPDGGTVFVLDLAAANTAVPPVQRK
jgi:PAS domain S-box-containing protein